MDGKSSDDYNIVSCGVDGKSSDDFPLSLVAWMVKVMEVILYLKV